MTDFEARFSCPGAKYDDDVMKHIECDVFLGNIMKLSELCLYVNFQFLLHLYKP
jgi:hypothetical protein